MSGVSILGGGLSGLACGYYLSKRGYETTIFEKEKKIGGLSASFHEGGDAIPLCYHHVMECDTFTQKKIIPELGLSDKFYWTKAPMGFLFKDEIFELKGLVDLLKFRPLSFLDRVRFGFLGLNVILNRDWSKLDNVYAEDWIKGLAGENVFNLIFKPLLTTKFGGYSKDICASWVGYRLSVRESRGNLGYIRGGVETLVSKLGTEILNYGGEIRTNSEVTKLTLQKDRIKKIRVQSDGKEEDFEPDCVVCALPIPELVRISEGLPKKFLENLRRVKYKATVSGVIALDKKFTDYYWTNLSDPQGLNMGGVFNHTILNPDVNDGNSLLYVFTYLDSSDKLWGMSEKDLIEMYLRELEEIYRGIRASVKWSRVFRLRYSKPVYEVGYKTYRPQTETPVKNLFLAGIGLFPPIRNIGNAMRSGLNAANACAGAIR